MMVGFFLGHLPLLVGKDSVSMGQLLFFDRKKETKLLVISNRLVVPVDACDFTRSEGNQPRKV
jgi:hypothetical protein